jgi:hypothetical protein
MKEILTTLQLHSEQTSMIIKNLENKLEDLKEVLSLNTNSTESKKKKKNKQFKNINDKCYHI